MCLFLKAWVNGSLEKNTLHRKKIIIKQKKVYISEKSIY
jgi:hypothetical protein